MVGCAIMSPARPFAVGIVALVSALAPTARVESSQPARDLVRAAQRAVGSGGNVSSIQSLRIEGSLKFRFNTVSGELRPAEPASILVKLPDHYLRQSSSPAGIVTREGFAGRGSLLNIVPPRGWVSSGSAPAAQSVAAPRRELARLMLGMLADPERVMRFTVTTLDANTFVATPEPSAPAMTVVLDSSRLPVAIREPGKLGFPRKLTDAERKAGVTSQWSPLEDVDITYTFSDRRNVGGFLLPHRVTKAARNVIFEDLRIETIVINPTLSPDDFTR